MALLRHSLQKVLTERKLDLTFSSDSEKNGDNEYAGILSIVQLWDAAETIF